MATPRTLLPYQQAWVRDSSGLKVIEKSRRIGLSWSEAYDSVMHAAEGGGDVYYQSYSREMARGFIEDAAQWAAALQIGADEIGETLIDAEGDAIQAFRVRLASGRKILAMSSAPRAFRSKGRPGDRAIVDEAAFVDDVAGVLKAALAFRLWGGTVHVLSTHNGEGSAFDVLVRDVRSGQRPGAVHRVTLADAIAQGLYRRICAVTDRAWSPEAEAAWIAATRAEYGDDAAEELDCVPNPGGGSWLSWPLIHAAEHAAAGSPAAYGGGACTIGVDIARRRDLWVAWVLEMVGDVLWTREVVAARALTFRAQADELDRLVRRYRPFRVAIDQTGMGEMPVEEAQRRYGGIIEGVLMSGSRPLDLATALRERCEDRTLRIPDADADLRRDLRAVRRVAGPTGAPRLITERTGEGSHADRFWALALAVGASGGGIVRPEYERVALDGRPDDDDDDDDAPDAGGWGAFAPRSRGFQGGSPCDL